MKRGTLLGVSVAVVMLILSFAILAGGALSRLCVLPLKPIEEDFINTVRLDEPISVSKILLPGTRIKFPVTQRQKSLIERAPASLEIGLSNYRLLSSQSRLPFAQTMCLAGNAGQIDRLAFLLKETPFSKEEKAEFLMYLRVIKDRGLALPLELIELFIEEHWSADSLLTIANEMETLIDYAGFIGELNRDNVVQVWSDFEVWWKTSRSNLSAVPGNRIRKLR